MKTKNKLPAADCRLPGENRNGNRRVFQIGNRKSEIANGFTLIELLVVISIIAVLAAFNFPVVGAVKTPSILQTSRRPNWGNWTTAIAAYKDAFGFYPPDNPGDPMINQLYYELEGTTNTSTQFTHINCWTAARNH